jgi:hypothetical protein
MFFNSVRGISNVITLAGLTPKNTKVVCANTKENKSKLPDGFEISGPNDPPKTINFYTSTCFEGCDIYDPIGRTFIICDPHRPNSLLDISTSMLQICGRIRDNEMYKDDMTIIFNTTRYEDEDTLEAYVERQKKEIEEADQIAKALNETPERFRNQIITRIKEFDAPFISVEDGQIVVDKNMINLDIVSYGIVHGLFQTQVNLDAGLSNNGFEIVERIYADGNFVDLMTVERISFRDCCEKYAAIKPQPGTYSLFEDERLVRLKNLCPEACAAVDTLGIETVRKMKYHKQNIQRKLVSSSGLAQDVKIKQQLDLRLNKFEAYSIPTIKKVLGEVYVDVGLAKKPVATDLNN